MKRAILSVEVRQQQDVVLTRQRARQIAALLGFDAQDQTRLATAVSEIARNALQYAGGGKAEFFVEGDATPVLLIQVRDRGPGFAVHAILDGHDTGGGKGLGLIGVRRLMDRFHIDSKRDAGTSVVFGKALPKRGLPTGDVSRLSAELLKRLPSDPYEEVREQNQELLRTLDELRQRQGELAVAHKQLQERELTLSQLNEELENTNRGVVALYAELEDKADFLGRASEMKSRFLSNMSHEFRTPLNAVTGLTRLLLDRVDGELTPEQEKQIRLIRGAAESLTELVNDLLDLAKVEAGKVTVRPTEFDIASLFGGLRGMLRPLLAANSSVELIFEEPPELPPLRTDESKVSQILRNFISNALKFTEKGEVRVAAATGANDTVIFSVADTGIGIAREDQSRIFEEFAQVEGPHQKRAKGTGLGLPLVKKLAGLLGGHVGLQSTVGVGSTFRVELPRIFQGAAEMVVVPAVSSQLDPTRQPVLVVEDNRETLFIYDKYLKGTKFQVLPAANLAAARQALAEFRPMAIILDVLLDRESGWDLLAELKANPATRSIPVFVVTLVENEPKARAMGADGYYAKPVDRLWLLDTLNKLEAPTTSGPVLLVDDDEASRYLLRGWLSAMGAVIVEASNGREGLDRALAAPPRYIFLDLDLPGQSGFDVLTALRAAAATRTTPVFINTARMLTEDERRRLFAAGATAVLSKTTLAGNEGHAVLLQALQRAGLER
jgi:signal transduction histidine kinase/CheY-like chemotaxis protein